MLLFSSPFIGGLLALSISSAKTNFLKLFLSFSAAFLFSVSITSLLPEIIHSGNEFTGVFVLLGFFLQIVIENFSKGAEHGHLHIEKDHPNGAGTSVLIALCLHSFFEGIPLGAGVFDKATFLPFLLGISLHELPASFTLLALFKAYKKPNSFLWLALIIYSSMAPIGAFAGKIFSDNIINPTYVNYLLALIVGTFLHISTVILFESSNKHVFARSKWIAILIGSAFGVLSIFLSH